MDLNECTHPLGGIGEDNRCPDCDKRLTWGRLPLIAAGLVTS